MLLVQGSVSQALGITKDEKALDGSREGNTDTVAGFQETNLVMMVVSY